MKWWTSLSASAVLALALFHAPAALAQTFYSGIEVDARPLARQGNPVLARNAARFLESSLQRQFADRMTRARGAPKLIVQLMGIQSAMLPSSGGTRHSGSIGGDANDYLEGKALIVAPGGRIVAEHPMMTVLNASYAGAWNAPDADRKRLQALTWQYAAWLRRKIGDL